MLTGTVAYREVAPQLVLMAYLHRLVNGGGFIGREVGVGRKRIDLLVRWPYENRRGKRAVQREALELKVWRDRDKKGDPLAAGLVQLDAYLATLGLSRGVLVIFDARADAAPVEERTRFEETVTAQGVIVAGAERAQAGVDQSGLIELIVPCPSAGRRAEVQRVA